jgi:hypothetical protein
MSDSSSDDNSLRMSQSLTVYEKRRWIKVTFNRETKRIRDVPFTYEELRRKIPARFPVLKLLIEHQYRPQELEISWRDSVVQNTEDLLSVMRTCTAENKILRLEVTTYDKIDSPPK